MKDRNKLYIPNSLKLRSEIFNGFGKDELVKTIFTCIVFGVIDTIIYLLTQNTVISVVFILTTVSGTILMFTKDHYNISVVDQVGFLFEYAFKQKNYMYKYEIGSEKIDEITTIKVGEYNNG
jgi:hypothetical protein